MHGDIGLQVLLQKGARGTHILVSYPNLRQFALIGCIRDGGVVIFGTCSSRAHFHPCHLLACHVLTAATLSYPLCDRSYVCQQVALAPAVEPSLITCVTEKLAPHGRPFIAFMGVTRGP